MAADLCSSIWECEECGTLDPGVHESWCDGRACPYCGGMYPDHRDGAKKCPWGRPEEDRP